MKNLFNLNVVYCIDENVIEKRHKEAKEDEKEEEANCQCQIHLLFTSFNLANTMQTN